MYKKFSKISSTYVNLMNYFEVDPDIFWQSASDGRGISLSVPPSSRTVNSQESHNNSFI